MGLVQCGKIDKIIAEKIRVAETYDRHLEGIDGLQLPARSTIGRHVYWMYGVVVEPSHRTARFPLNVAYPTAVPLSFTAYA